MTLRLVTYGTFLVSFQSSAKIECEWDMCNENSAEQHGAAAGSVRVMQQVEYHQMYSKLKVAEAASELSYTGGAVTVII